MHAFWNDLSADTFQNGVNIRAIRKYYFPRSLAETKSVEIILQKLLAYMHLDAAKLTFQFSVLKERDYWRLGW